MPSDRPDGRLYILHIVADGGSPVSDVSGWTRIDRATQGSTNPVSSWIGWRIGSSEPASYTGTTDGGGSEGFGALVVGFDRFNATTPIHTFATNSGATSAPTSSGITTSVADCAVLWACGCDSSSSIPSTSPTWPSGYVGLEQVVPSFDAGMSVALKLQQMVGGVSAAAGSLLGSDDWIAYAVAIAGDPNAPEITAAAGSHATWLQDSEAGVVFTGVNFGASQGAGTLELWDTLTGATQIAQTVTSWSATSITATIGRSTLAAGRLYAVVTTNGGLVSDPFRVVVLPAAPDFKVAEVRVSANTSAGDQDITSGDISGITPKAVMFRMVRATADGLADNWGICIGFATSSSARAVVSTKSADASNPTNVGRKLLTTACLSGIDPASTTSAEEFAADFVSFISGGCRINWSTAPASGYQIIATFFCGTHVQASVSNSAPTVLFTPGSSSSIYAQLPSAIGDPDFIFSLLTTASSPGTTSSNAIMAFGVAASNGFEVDSVHPQVGLKYSSADNAATEDASLLLLNDAAFPSSGSSGYAKFRREYRDRDVGYAIAIQSVSFGQLYICRLDLIIPGVRSWVGSLDPSTSTGDQAITAPGWLTQYVGTIQSMATAYGTAQTNDNANAYSIATVAGAVSSATGVGLDDGSSGANTATVLEDRLIYLADTQGGDLFVGSFVSFDSTGWTWNYTTAQGTQRKWLGWAMEGQPAGGGSPVSVLVSGAKGGGAAAAFSVSAGMTAGARAAVGLGSFAIAAFSAGDSIQLSASLARGGSSAASVSAGASLAAAAARGGGAGGGGSLLSGASVLTASGTSLGAGQAAQIAAGASLAALAAVARGGLSEAPLSFGASLAASSARGGGFSAAADDVHGALIDVLGAFGRGTVQVSVVFTVTPAEQIQRLRGALLLAPVLSGALVVDGQLRGQIEWADLVQGMVGLDEE